MFGYYLMFNRNCADAIAAYAKAFGVKIVEKQTLKEMTQTGSQFPFAKEDMDLIVYSKIKVGKTEIVCFDSSERSLPGLNMYIFIKDDKETVQKAWAVLSQGGKIYASLESTTFAVLHGSLQDKFGVNWMFSVPKPKEPKESNQKTKTPMKLKLPKSKVQPKLPELKSDKKI